ncbi:hypothetical protein [Streptomyces sp. NPDC007172]|uniref:hypothetical protein n=1 Tax=Streptomyces sp. NPDC007172 TaxID=3364776 RepID=UPI003677577E
MLCGESPPHSTPPQDYWCAYAESWTTVKAAYHLTVTDAEKAKLADMLTTCPA